MSARFRVGDKVIIRGYVHERGEHFNFIPEMDEYIGKIARVRRVFDDMIKLDIDNGHWTWHPSWLAYPKKGRVDIYEC
jgi:hypothetical protein